MSVFGNCLCGSVSFFAKSEINWSCYCHCDDCRRNCAAPVVAFLGVSLEGFSWNVDGENREPKHFESSSGVRRFFCDNCGTPMAFQAEHYEGEIALYAATLAEPAEFQPQFHVHHQSSLSWLAIDDNLQKFKASAPNDKIPHARPDSPGSKL